MANQDILIQKLAFGAEGIALLRLKLVKLPITLIKVLSGFLRMIMVNRYILKTLHKTEQEKCFTCDEHCGILFKKTLEKVLTNEKDIFEMVSAAPAIPIPWPMGAIAKAQLSRIEDRLENLWIISDPEIKDILSQVSIKLKEDKSVNMC